MRHLLSTKVAFLALLLLLLALPATAAPAEVAGAYFGDISAWLGELVASLLGAEAPDEIAHSYPPNGLTGEVRSETSEISHGYPPNGLNGEEPPTSEIAHSYPPSG